MGALFSEPDRKGENRAQSACVPHAKRPAHVSQVPLPPALPPAASGPAVAAGVRPMAPLCWPISRVKWQVVPCISVLTEQMGRVELVRRVAVE